MIDFMQGRSYQIKTALEEQCAWNKIFLAFKNSPGNRLGRLPLGVEILKAATLIRPLGTPLG